MSVTNPSAPEPIAGIEQDIADAVPAAVRPEVEALESEANATLADAASKAPATEAQAAADEPGVAAAGQDIERIFSGDAVPFSTIVHDVPNVVKNVKAGYKTTEFWLTAVALVATQVSALTLPGKYGPAISEVAGAVGVGLYALSRGHAKN